GVRALLTPRLADARFGSGSVRVPNGHLAFVYKAAAEIGELGDNTARLRDDIRDDVLLHLALDGDASEVAVVGHTRRASVGVISEANAHPLDQRELQPPGSVDVTEHYVTAALNGDVDNHLDLREREHLRIHPSITTDAKVIPVLVARRLASGLAIGDAF